MPNASKRQNPKHRDARAKGGSRLPLAPELRREQRTVGIFSKGRIQNSIG